MALIRDLVFGFRDVLHVKLGTWLIPNSYNDFKIDKKRHFIRMVPIKYMNRKFVTKY